MSVKTCIKGIFSASCAFVSAVVISSCAAAEWIEDAFDGSTDEPDTPIVTQPAATGTGKIYTEQQAVQYAANKLTFFLSVHGATPCPGIKAETTEDAFVREVLYELLNSNVATWGNDFIVSSKKQGNAIVVIVSGKENYSFRINVKEETLP